MHTFLNVIQFVGGLWLWWQFWSYVDRRHWSWGMKIPGALIYLLLLVMFYYGPTDFLIERLTK